MPTFIFVLLTAAVKLWPNLVLKVRIVCCFINANCLDNPDGTTNVIPVNKAGEGCVPTSWVGFNLGDASYNDTSNCQNDYFPIGKRIYPMQRNSWSKKTLPMSTVSPGSNHQLDIVGSLYKSEIFSSHFQFFSFWQHKTLPNIFWLVSNL